LDPEWRKPLLRSRRSIGVGAPRGSPCATPLRAPPSGLDELATPAGPTRGTPLPLRSLLWILAEVLLLQSDLATGLPALRRARTADPLLLHPPAGELRGQPQPAPPTRRAHAVGASPTLPTPSASARGRPSPDPPNRRRALGRALPALGRAALRCRRGGAAHPFPNRVATPPPRAGRRVSRGAVGRVHGSHAAPLPAGQAVEPGAKPMFSMMLQAYVLSV
jgi:hypothetical protein